MAVQISIPQLEAGDRIDSRVMPGLRLDVPALLAGDLAGLLAGLHDQAEGLAHASFVEHLAERGRQAR